LKGTNPLSPRAVTDDNDDGLTLWKSSTDESIVDPLLLMLGNNKSEHKIDREKPTLKYEGGYDIHNFKTDLSDARQLQGWLSSSIDAIHPSEFNETSCDFKDPEIPSWVDFGYSEESTNGQLKSRSLLYPEICSPFTHSSAVRNSTQSQSISEEQFTGTPAWAIHEDTKLERWTTDANYTYPSPEITLEAYRSISPTTSSENSTYSELPSAPCLASQRSNTPTFSVDDASKSAESQLGADEVEEANNARRRKEEDAFIISMRKQGMKFKDIMKLGGFTLAESTIRGRYRMLTKPKHERVRKPIWRKRDDELLISAVKHLSSADRIAQVTCRVDMRVLGVSWDAVRFWIRDHGGSYGFASAACKKRWMLLNHMK
jgi:hypothetical protein